MISPLHGHVWTLWPRLRGTLRPLPPPPSRHWRTTLRDPRVGELTLSGRLHDGGGDELLVVVHGLGGSHRSPYMVAAARAAARLGMACLRLDLRGADRRGHDFYHAGLTADLRAALAAPDLARFRRVALLGYSLGGHVCLRYAAEGDVDPRLAALATICAPLDLEAGARAIDRPERRLYRAHVLRGLKAIYAEVARRREVPLPLAEAQRITTLREWDERIVAPRFGFASAEEYWRSQAAGPVLTRVAVPAALIVTRHDPMVPLPTLAPYLPADGPVQTRILPTGGHVGFPRGIDLGLGQGAGGEGSGADGVEEQVLGWLRRAGRSGS